MVEKRNGAVICDNVIGRLLTNIQGIIFCMTPVRYTLNLTLSFVMQLEMKAKNYHKRKYPTLSHVIGLTELISTSNKNILYTRRLVVYRNQR